MKVTMKRKMDETLEGEGAEGPESEGRLQREGNGSACQDARASRVMSKRAID